MVNKAVNEYWIEHIKKMSTYLKSLYYLNQIVGSRQETQFDMKSCYISSWRLDTSQGCMRFSIGIIGGIQII
jgi:hypothetical protein